MWQSELICCVLPSWIKCYSHYFIQTALNVISPVLLTARLPRFIIPIMPIIFQRGHPFLSQSASQSYPHQHPIRSFLFSLPRLSKYADSFNFLLAADQTESARRAEDHVRGVGRARLSKYERLVYSQNTSALERCLSLNAE